MWPIGALLLSGLAFGIWWRYSGRIVLPDEFEYELGMVCVMANEARYIREWLSWHRDQGVEHFFIYDNDPLESDCKEVFGESLLPHITVERWLGRKEKGLRGKLSPQRQAYNHSMENYAGLCRYVLVCDVDEFAMPAPGSSHERVIDVLRELPENIAWIEITRRDFGHRPHQKRPEGGVVDNYVWRSAMTPKYAMKSLINGALASHISWSNGVHRPRWKRFKWPLRQRGWVRRLDDERLLRINHYYTKSAEEWQERGRFWEGKRFNKTNTPRSEWRGQPPEEYSEVKDDHALTIKARVIARAALERE